MRGVDVTLWLGGCVLADAEKARERNSRPNQHTLPTHLHLRTVVAQRPAEEHDVRLGAVDAVCIAFGWRAGGGGGKHQRQGGCRRRRRGMHAAASSGLPSQLPESSQCTQPRLCCTPSVRHCASLSSVFLGRVAAMSCGSVTCRYSAAAAREKGRSRGGGGGCTRQRCRQRRALLSAPPP